MLRLTHIGGPTVLIEINGVRILTDPTFDPPISPTRFPELEPARLGCLEYRSGGSCAAEP